MDIEKIIENATDSEIVEIAEDSQQDSSEEVELLESETEENAIEEAYGDVEAPSVDVEEVSEMPEVAEASEVAVCPFAHA